MKPEQQAGFDKFWKEHWPKCRRKAKPQAAAQWTKISPALYPVIYAAVDRQKKQSSWNKDDCAFIPYPHRWLRDRRWEDEISLPEDKDAEILIEALRAGNYAPQGFPAHILHRYQRMCQRKSWNWPLLHYRINNNGAAEEIKKAYLATE